MQPVQLQADHPLRKLLDGSVQQVFHADLGICDPRLTDYLVDLLIEFIHVDRIFRLQNVDGQKIREVSRMEADAQLPEGVSGTHRTCIVNRYIGDFTLFWAGLYPEALRPRLAGSDRLREYLLQGKRSYEIASTLTQPDARPPADLLRRLSREFEACVHGLQCVRCAWQPPTGVN